jgi:hypothetical protein
MMAVAPLAMKKGDQLTGFSIDVWYFHWEIRSAAAAAVG